MKAENSRMVEEMQKMQEDFGMVSCPGILRSRPSLCCPATPALQPLEAPSMKGTRRDEREGCPRLFMGIVGCWVKGSSQPTWSPPTFLLPALSQGGQKGTTAHRSGWW